MFDRPGRPSDKFVAPYANEKAARAANNGAYPPDQSLLVKARHHGADYIYAVLNGYEDAPADFKLSPGMNYNKYFPGHQIAMGKPLSDGQVTYSDGTQATVAQMSHDVVTFLAWAAEPELEARHETGARVMLFLLVLTGLFYFSYKRLWRNIKKK
jgi:ubiquinol-cytochrome c reductase cytochrome c1 subunit